MNFLAHLYLAKSPEGQIGNFIADAIKGKKYDHLPLEIQKGIIHHRAIDTFTDSHKIVKKSKRRLNPKYGHFKAVIIDIIYDHYLAKNWHKYSNTDLNTFTQNSYQLLEDNFEILPERTQYLLPFMKQQNWLYNYRSVEGISKILWGMNKRTKGISQMDLAKDDLIENYKAFENDFELFFKELQEFSKEFKI
ncbi:ACP phosphodiesterase [Bacteroidota bacterium]